MKVVFVTLLIVASAWAESEPRPTARFCPPWLVYCPWLVNKPANYDGPNVPWRFKSYERGTGVNHGGPIPPTVRNFFDWNCPVWDPNCNLSMKSAMKCYWHNGERFCEPSIRRHGQFDYDPTCPVWNQNCHDSRDFKQSRASCLTTTDANATKRRRACRRLHRFNFADTAARFQTESSPSPLHFITFTRAEQSLFVFFCGMCADVATPVRSSNRMRTLRESKSRISQIEKEALISQVEPNGKIKLEKIPSRQAANKKILDEEPYYHGFMSVEETKHLLAEQGEFLVRKADLSSGLSFLISIFWDNEVKHIAILRTKTKGYYYVHRYCFESVPDLIRYHQRKHIAIDKEVPIQLRTFHERDNWQLYHEQVEMGKKLGNGEFGEVFSGKLTNGLFGKPVEVAVKTLKPGSLCPDNRIKFLREANLMLKIRHSNVIRLYGVCTTREPIMIVMEMAPGGSLLDCVRKAQNPPNTEKKISYLVGVAEGMAHLEQELVIHRDLAARNCLIGKDDQAKISDFGLSLSGVACLERSKLKKVPVRWIAPETLTRGTYSNKSDVWSYGVVVWEVFNKGRLPYKEIGKNKEVRKKVLEGYRLPPGEEITREMKNVMIACFTTNPNDRPTFHDLLKMLKGDTQPKKSFFSKLFRSKEKSKPDITPRSFSLQGTQKSKSVVCSSAKTSMKSTNASCGNYTTMTIVTET